MKDQATTICGRFLVRLKDRFLVPATASIGTERSARQGWPQATAQRLGLDG